MKKLLFLVLIFFSAQTAQASIFDWFSSTFSVTTLYSSSKNGIASFCKSFLGFWNKKQKPSNAIIPKAADDMQFCTFSKAIGENNFKEVSKLLNKGFDVHMKNEGGDTVLHCAAQRGRVRIAELLLRSGAKEEINAYNSSKNTPLLLAVGENHKKMVELLLDFDAQKDKGCKFAGKETLPLDVAIDCNNCEIVQLFFDYRITEKNRQNLPCKMCEVIKDNKIDLMRVLIKNNVDIHSKINKTETPLMLATCSGKVEMVNLLIDSGADVNVQNEKGKSLLHLWDGKNDSALENIALACQRGAEITTVDKNRETAVHDAVFRSNGDIKKLNEFHQEKLKLLLYYAWRDNKLERLLNIKNNDNETAQEIAQREKNLSIAEFLKKCKEGNGQAINECIDIASKFDKGAALIKKVKSPHATSITLRSREVTGSFNKKLLTSSDISY